MGSGGGFKQGGRRRRRGKRNQPWRSTLSAQPTAEYVAADYADYNLVPHLGDNTGGGRRLTSSSGREPTYGATTVGSGPGLSYAAAGDWHDGATAADWALLHGATDSTIELRYQCDAASGTNVIACTNTPGSGVGVYIAHDATNQRLQIQWRDGTGAIGTHLGTASSAANGAAHHVFVTIDRSAETYSVRLDGTWVATDVAFARTPSASDPAGPLRIGAALSGSFALTGAVQRLTVWGSVLTADDLATIETNAPDEASQRVRHVVLIIGDSIAANTQGRRQLYLRYIDSGTHRLQMVGHATAVDALNPTTDHGGVSGYRVDEWQADQAANFAGVSEAPDFILSQLGMNDAVDNSGAWGDYTGSDERLVDLITDALAEWPAATAILCEVTPSTTAAINTRIGEINIAIAAQATAQGWGIGASTLEAADISGDNIHPTPGGYVKLGDDWARTLGVL